MSERGQYQKLTRAKGSERGNSCGTCPRPPGAPAGMSCAFFDVGAR